MGPEPVERSVRMRRAQDIAARIQEHYGDDVLAIGIYGSLARGTDAPYSDIEMHCILKHACPEITYEWSPGTWKAEINVWARDVILRKAAIIQGDWSFTHSALTEVFVLYDEQHFFPLLRQTAIQHPDEIFNVVIHEVIVGDIYELIGKIRNAQALNNLACVPYFYTQLVKYGACLIGLANRHLYSTTANFMQEVLALPQHPVGYDTLCQTVMTGQLANIPELIRQSNEFWHGVCDWAQARKMTIFQNLEEILAK